MKREQPRQGWVYEESLQRRGKREHRDALLRDTAVMLALLILLLAVLWLFDTGRYEWMLETAVGLGAALNACVAAIFVRTDRRPAGLTAALLAVICAGVLVYLVR